MRHGFGVARQEILFASVGRSRAFHASNSATLTTIGETTTP